MAPTETVGHWLTSGEKIRRIEIEAFNGKVEIELVNHDKDEHWFSGLLPLADAYRAAADAIGKGEI